MTSVADDRTPGRARSRVHPRVEWAAAYAWRLLVIAVAVAGLLWLLGQLIVVVISLAAALLLIRALVGPARWLEARGLPRSVAAALAVMLSILIFLALVAVVGFRVASEFDQLGTTVSQGVDNVETWLVEDSPFDIDQSRVTELRQEAGSRLASIAWSSSDSLMSTAVLAIEFVSGLLLALIVTFFVVKDRAKIAARGCGQSRKIAVPCCRLSACEHGPRSAATSAVWDCWA